MSDYIPRVRMFAGPNGSGKSTIKKVLRPDQIYTYINPDEIEIEIRDSGFYDLSKRGVVSNVEDIKEFFRESGLTKSASLVPEVGRLHYVDGKIDFREVEFNRYWPSVASDFLRHVLLKKGESFTFETVMSSHDKVDFLQKARDTGYRTYLYYVSTADPEINVSRVKNRVASGGHSVPEQKIRQRYDRSLGLLYEAYLKCNRAFFFDNSREGADQLFIARAENGRVTLEVDEVPAWFNDAVLSKLKRAS